MLEICTSCLLRYHADNATQSATNAKSAPDALPVDAPLCASATLADGLAPALNALAEGRVLVAAVDEFGVPLVGLDDDDDDDEGDDEAAAATDESDEFPYVIAAYFWPAVGCASETERVPDAH